MSGAVVRSSPTLPAVVGVAVLLLASCASAPAPAGSLSGSPSAAVSPSPLAAPTLDEPSSQAAGPLPGEPDPIRTPGATNPAVTQATIGSTICVSGWTATVRPPSSYTTSLKALQIAEYGYADTSLADYEEDHLISLELGGDPRDPRNLWPEPYAVSLSDGRSVGARVKDQLENRLHDLVCSGQMTLATAQSDIAEDWIVHWFELTGQAPPPGSGAPTPGPEPGATPAASAAASAAPATGVFVQITKLTSPVARGHYATAAVATIPYAACGIEVVYKSGPSSASGLGSKTASGAGTVSWTWRVGSGTTTGTWPVTVSCSAGGSTASATRTFRVT